MDEKEYIKYGKTLRELLRTSDFNRIAEYVSKDKDAGGSIEAYREAYDILLNTVASEEGCYRIDVHWYDLQPYEGEGRILFASQIEGQPWENLIDGNIYVVDKDIMEVPQEELAYRLLWHLTFFGFNDEDKKEAWYRIINGDYPRNEYGEKVRELELKQDMLCATPAIRRRIIASIKEFAERDELQYALTGEDWNTIHHRREHCNRSKRKRAYRIEKRIETLKELASKSPQRPIDGYSYRYKVLRL